LQRWPRQYFIKHFGERKASQKIFAALMAAVRAKKGCVIGMALMMLVVVRPLHWDIGVRPLLDTLAERL
jgi:hypothetical protein